MHLLVDKPRTLWKAYIVYRVAYVMIRHNDATECCITKGAEPVKCGKLADNKGP